MDLDDAFGKRNNVDESMDNFPVGMRVLVVDDDPVCLLLLQRMLKQCSYTVTVCGSANTALAMLRERRDAFDLVISDVHMPDMDGFRLLELVGLEMDLPVIMMSANGETSTVMKGINHGACDYLLKPVRLEELRNIWQHVIRRRVPSAKKSSHPAEEHSGSLDDSDPKKKKAMYGEREREKEDEITSSMMVTMNEYEEENVSYAKKVVGSPGNKNISNSVSVAISPETIHSVNAANVSKSYAKESALAGGGGGGGYFAGKKRKEMKEEEDSYEEDERDTITGLKKSRVVWSPELHQQFVNSVNQLGVDKAVPKRILEIMNVQGLTRENVASHLQKYRLYLKRLSNNCENSEKDKTMPQYGLRVMNPMHQKQLQMAEKVKDKFNSSPVFDKSFDNQDSVKQSQTFQVESRQNSQFRLQSHQQNQQSQQFQEYVLSKQNPNHSSSCNDGEFDSKSNPKIRQNPTQQPPNLLQLRNHPMLDRPNQQQLQNIQNQSQSENLSMIHEQAQHLLKSQNQSQRSILNTAGEGLVLNSPQFSSPEGQVAESTMLTQQLSDLPNIALIQNLQAIRNPLILSSPMQSDQNLLSYDTMATPGRISDLTPYQLQLLNHSINNLDRPIDLASISNSLNHSHSLMQNQHSQLQGDLSKTENFLSTDQNNSNSNTNLYSSGLVCMDNGLGGMHDVAFKPNDSDTLDAMINSGTYRENIDSCLPSTEKLPNLVGGKEKTITEPRKKVGEKSNEFILNQSFHPLHAFMQLNSEPPIVSSQTRLSGMVEKFQNPSTNSNSRYGFSPPYQSLSRSQNYSQSQSQNQSNTSDSPRLTGDSGINGTGSSQEASAGYMRRDIDKSDSASQLHFINPSWKEVNQNSIQNLQSMNGSIRNAEADRTVMKGKEGEGEYYQNVQENVEENDLSYHHLDRTKSSEEYNRGNDGHRDGDVGESNEGGRGIEMKERALNTQDRMNSEDIFRSLLRQESELPEFGKLEQSNNEDWIDSRG